MVQQPVSSPAAPVAPQARAVRSRAGCRRRTRFAPRLRRCGRDRPPRSTSRRRRQRGRIAAAAPASRSAAIATPNERAASVWAPAAIAADRACVIRERASSTARPRERSLLSDMIRFASGLAGDTASTPPAAAAASSKRPASKCEPRVAQPAFDGVERLPGRGRRCVGPRDGSESGAGRCPRSASRRRSRPPERP